MESATSPWHKATGKEQRTNLGRKAYFFLLPALAVVLTFYLASSARVQIQHSGFEGSRPEQGGWVSMPPGAKPAYMGIHGGTVPISLLATQEGTGLVAFVGRTGNDFLNLLRRAETFLPSLLNATKNAEGEGLSNGSLAPTKLTAGSLKASMPVLKISWEKFADILSGPSNLRPFGLSSSPLSIEGEVSRPDPNSRPSKYHLLVSPHYLQPRPPSK